MIAVPKSLNEALRSKANNSMGYSRIFARAVVDGGWGKIDIEKMR